LEFAGFGDFLEVLGVDVPALVFLIEEPAEDEYDDTDDDGDDDEVDDDGENPIEVIACCCRSGWTGADICDHYWIVAE
jgi:hypothetical protein